ncbi:MAG: glycosyltransferase [Thermoguttaceae bacterium]|jgi:glycosyltransferase involved in cell wall biosynthesis
MASIRPRILAVLHGFIPSAMITVVKPLVELHRAGRLRARIILESLATPGDIRRADLVVFCRNMEPKHASLLDAARARRIPFLYDLDDNLFEVPPDCDVGRYCRAPERQAMLTEYLRAADLVRVYSKTLEARVAALNPRVERTFAPIDLDQVAVAPASQPTDEISIVYATSRVRDDLSRIFLPALGRVLAEYPGRVRAHFWGHKPAILPTGASHHRPVCQYDHFLRRFSRAGFQIGLAPLADDQFYRSKTNNKFREYGACGIAGIYSNVDVYSDCVTDGRTGLLAANNSDDWYGAMVRLIEDRPLRTGIQERARACVREHYSQGKFEQVFWREIEDLLGSPARRLPGPPCKKALTSPKAPSLKRGGVLRRIRQLGPQGTWNSLRWAANDGWTLLRLRCRLWTPLADLRERLSRGRGLPPSL